MNNFNPKYPKNPQTLGEKIRKARMDKGLLIRQLTSQVGVTEDTVINWEIRGMKPRGRIREARGFLRIFECGETVELYKE